MQCNKCSTFYDPNQHSNCPYCPVHGISIEPIDTGKTIGEIVSPVPLKAQNTPNNEIEQQVGIPINNPRIPVEDSKTVGVFDKKLKFDPVVGWLICIDGKDKGQDFRIYSNRNFIGRSSNMSICIKGDNTVSRERHAEINFDVRYNKFYIAPGESRGNTYLNEQIVGSFTQLNAWDVIDIGETKLVFIPLCGPNFNWNTGLQASQDSE
ncbi:hypothetical protein TI05_08700 [Achromatium sp. WMS3]|nr:hypothetical protein TI05_08700 [Achromatium sp. WMS3]